MITEYKMYRYYIFFGWIFKTWSSVYKILVSFNLY